MVSKLNVHKEFFCCVQGVQCYMKTCTHLSF